MGVNVFTTLNPNGEYYYYCWIAAPELPTRAMYVIARVRFRIGGLFGRKSDKTQYGASGWSMFLAG